MSVKILVKVGLLFLSASTFQMPLSHAYHHYKAATLASDEVVLGKVLPGTQLVQKLSRLSPKEIVSFIEADGVSVFRFHDSEDKQPNEAGNFSFVTKASSELLEKVGLEEGDEGLHLNANDPCCALSKPTIFIEAKAPVMSLIHEYMHELFERVDKNPELRKAAVSDSTEQAYKKIEFYIKKALAGSIDVSNPLWRRDLKGAIEDFEVVIPAITHLFTEEALIEGLLVDVFTENNPNFNKERSELGIQYGEFSLSNLERKILALDHLIFWYKDALSLEDSFDGKAELEKELADYQNRIIPAHRAKLEVAREWFKKRVGKSK